MPQSLSDPQLEVLLILLREARARLGVTQAELADATGFRQADISKTERGVRRLDVLELRSWMRALGIDFVHFCQQLDERLVSAEALQRHASALIGTKGAVKRGRRQR